MQVVPFSPSAGLLQWVEDTMPLVEYLTGPERRTGAHLRYAGPDTLSFAECYSTIYKCQRSQLRQLFDQVSAEMISMQLFNEFAHTTL